MQTSADKTCGGRTPDAALTASGVFVPRMVSQSLYCNTDPEVTRGGRTVDGEVGVNVATMGMCDPVESVVVYV